MTLLDANTADAKNKTKNKEIERLLQTHNRQQRKRRDELGRNNNNKITVFFFILLFNQNFIQSDDETKEESLKPLQCLVFTCSQLRSEAYSFILALLIT